MCNESHHDGITSLPATMATLKREMLAELEASTPAPTTAPTEFSALLEAFRIDAWIDGHDGDVSPTAHTEAARAAVEAHVGRLERELDSAKRRIVADNDERIRLVALGSRLEGELEQTLDKLERQYDLVGSLRSEREDLEVTVARLEGERDAALSSCIERMAECAILKQQRDGARDTVATLEARVVALTAELEFGRGVLVDTRTKLFAWADKYESALRAIADQHNNPHCACVFCEDLWAALGSSGGASHGN